MKRLLCLFISLLLLALTLVPVSADVIWEPENNFYEQHRNECQYVNRKYTVNGAEGYASLYKSPVASNNIMENYTNGDCVYISHTYTDKNGEVWGLPDHGQGWFRMKDLHLIYDSIQFIEDHRAELTDTYAAIPSVESLPQDIEIVVWNYPGGERQPYTANIQIMVNGGFDCFYTDVAGNVWAHVAYFQGSRDIWICASDLTCQTLSEVVPTKPADFDADLVPAIAASALPQAKSTSLAPWLIAAGIVIVVVLTMVVIKICFKKKENRE